MEKNQELFELRQSLEKEGVLVPLIIRYSPDGDGYEIVAGHRRKAAAIWAGMEEVPAVIRELDNDQAIIAMVDSNLQREEILPSEKAFAYKMRLQAMSHQGKTNFQTSDPLGPKNMEEVSILETEVSEYGKYRLNQLGNIPKGKTGCNRFFVPVYPYSV